MRNTTRFIYVSDQRVTSSWQERPSSTAVSFWWRLIAANNRPIATSVRAFSSLEECAQSAANLSVEPERLEARVLFDEHDAGWWWTIRRSDVAVAECVYPAKRRVEAVRATQQFLTVVGTAPHSPVIVRPLGIYAHGRDTHRRLRSR